MLIAKPQEPADYVRGLTVMSRDCERLESLLNRMLQTARAEQRIADGHRRPLEPIDVASSCESAIAKLAQCAADKQIRIDFSATEEALIRAEFADLELIWLNILENAIQYSPRESVVAVSCRVQSNLITVTVSDHGCELSPPTWIASLNASIAPILPRPRHGRFRAGPGDCKIAGHLLCRANPGRELTGKGHSHLGQLSPRSGPIPTGANGWMTEKLFLVSDSKQGMKQPRISDIDFRQANQAFLGICGPWLKAAHQQ